MAFLNVTFTFRTAASLTAWFGVWLKLYGTNVGNAISSVAVNARNNIFASGFTDGAFAGFTNEVVNIDAFINSFTPSGVQC
jgi:hypothetical protein